MSDLAVKLSKIVHDACPDAPHDIGLRLEEKVIEYKANKAVQNLIENQKGIPPDFSDAINKNFWELIDGKSNLPTQLRVLVEATENLISATRVIQSSDNLVQATLDAAIEEAEQSLIQIKEE